MKKIYNSIYGATHKLTASQYLSELICNKMAEQNNTTLPNRFWQDKDSWWSKKFISEKIQADKLLKKYNINSIKEALKDYRSKNVKSLFNKQLTIIIKEKQQKLDEIKQIKTELKINKNTKSRPPKKFGKPSRISKLKE